MFYLLEALENKCYEVAGSIIIKHGEKKDKKEKAKREAAEKKEATVKAREESLSSQIEKLNIEEVPYTEDAAIFLHSIKNKIPAIRAFYNIEKKKSHHYKTHYTDNDGLVKELNHSVTDNAVNFVQRAMQCIDEHHKATSKLERASVILNYHKYELDNLEYYDYRLMNNGSVLFIKKED